MQIYLRYWPREGLCCLDELAENLVVNRRIEGFGPDFVVGIVASRDEEYELRASGDTEAMRTHEELFGLVPNEPLPALPDPRDEMTEDEFNKTWTVVRNSIVEGHRVDNPRVLRPWPWAFVPAT